MIESAENMNRNLVMVLHIYNTNTCNAESGGLVIIGQPGLQKEGLESYLKGRYCSVGIELGLASTGHPTPATHKQGRAEQSNNPSTYKV